MTRSEWPAEVQKALNDFDAGGSRQKTNPTESWGATPNTISSNQKIKEKEDNSLNSSVHRKTLRELLVRSLNLDLTEEKWLSSRNTFNWDSLNHLNVITCLEESFGILIPPETHSELMDEKSILAYLERELRK
jgi:acyl carrier protein